jgi:hypothetical protein
MIAPINFQSLLGWTNISKPDKKMTQVVAIKLRWKAASTHRILTTWQNMYFIIKDKRLRTPSERARSERFVLTITRGAKSATLGALGLWVSVEQCSAPVWPRCSSLGFSRAMVRDASKQAARVRAPSPPSATAVDGARCPKWLQLRLWCNARTLYIIYTYMMMCILY